MSNPTHPDPQDSRNVPQTGKGQPSGKGSGPAQPPAMVPIFSEPPESQPPRVQPPNAPVSAQPPFQQVPYGQQPYPPANYPQAPYAQPTYPPAANPQAPFAPAAYPQQGYGQPPYGQPPYGQPYAGVPIQSGPSKPISITLFGVTNLIVSFFSLAWVAGLLIWLVTWPGSTGQPMQDVRIPGQPSISRYERDGSLTLIYEQTGYFQYQIFIIVLGALLGLVLLVAGVLLLMGKEKGRDLSISYSIGSIILNVLSIGFQVYTGVVLLNSFDAPRRITQEAGTMLIFGGVVMFFFLLYPTLVLIFMTRKSVKDYLART